MQETIEFNFLIIGRSGAGKSATTKLLTGDPSITVANSLKQVTTDVQYYRGMKIQLPNQSCYIRFNVLDIPGLDKLNNRFIVRKKLLEQLEKNKISLNGIIYVSSLTERDTIDCNKLFHFIAQLPWSQEAKKNALIPILTKYDNLIIDSPQQQIQSIKQQYSKIFEEANYSISWSKRVYWINHTKSLEFKMKIREEIKQIFSKQIIRLFEIVKKNKNLLTADSIHYYISKQQQYVSQKILKQILNEQIPCKREQIDHSIVLKVMIRPKKVYQSVTTVSASSIGIIISQCCKQEVPSSLCLILSGIPMLLTFWNLSKSKIAMKGQSDYKKSQNLTKNQQHLQSICNGIYIKLQNQWKRFVQNLQFYIDGQFLYCKLEKSTIQEYEYGLIQPYKTLELRTNQKIFEKKIIFTNQQSANMNSKSVKKSNGTMKLLFKLQIPQFQQQTIWQPQIHLSCSMKVFEEQILLKFIENNRVQFLGEQNSHCQKFILYQEQI